ncbi:hypothetical protein NUSPORA_01747 [Nucleospora cyclopteri]
MYPSTLIRLNKNKMVTVELKNSAVIKGFMVNCDIAMNMHLQNVKLEQGGKTYRVEEMYLKGHCVKQFQLLPWVLTKQAKFL